MTAADNDSTRRGPLRVPHNMLHTHATEQGLCYPKQFIPVVITLGLNVDQKQEQSVISLSVSVVYLVEIAVFLACYFTRTTDNFSIALVIARCNTANV